MWHFDINTLPDLSDSSLITLLGIPPTPIMDCLYFCPPAKGAVAHRAELHTHTLGLCRCSNNCDEQFYSICAIYILHVHFHSIFTSFSINHVTFTFSLVSILFVLHL